MLLPGGVVGDSQASSGDFAPPPSGSPSTRADDMVSAVVGRLLRVAVRGYVHCFDPDLMQGITGIREYVTTCACAGGP